MWKLGINFLMHAILMSSENVQNHFHRLLLHLRSQTKIMQFSLMYGIIILSNNYWFSLPLDMLIILISHTHTHECVHTAWCCRRKDFNMTSTIFSWIYRAIFSKKKVIRNWNVHLIHDKAGNSCLFKDYKRIQFMTSLTTVPGLFFTRHHPYSFQVLS